MTEKPPRKRGFAAMDPAKRKLIAAKGGASVPSDKRSFSKDHKLASGAGQKGGWGKHGQKRKTFPPGTFS